MCRRTVSRPARLPCPDLNVCSSGYVLDVHVSSGHVVEEAVGGILDLLALPVRESVCKTII